MLSKQEKRELCIAVNEIATQMRDLGIILHGDSDGWKFSVEQTHALASGVQAHTAKLCDELLARINPEVYG